MTVEARFLVGLTGVALVGLLIAWRWDLVGGIFAIAVLVVGELAWVTLKGNWPADLLFPWKSLRHRRSYS